MIFLSVDIGKALSDFFQSLVDNLFKVEIAISLAVAIVAMVLWKLYKRWRKKYRASHDNTEHLLFSSVSYSIIRILFLFVTIIVILQINGVNVTSLVTGLGLASAIVGLALQDFLKDVIMGFHIRTDDFFKEGDVVEYKGVVGEIVTFTVKTTKIKDLKTEDVLSLCNRDITEIKKVSGVVPLEYSLSYESDPVEVENVLKMCCKKVEAVDFIESCTYLGLQAFGDSAVTYKLVCKTSPKRVGDALRAANMLVFKTLNENGLSIPYPQLDIHTK